MSTLIDDLQAGWDRWSALVADNVAVVAGIGIALILVLVALALVLRHRRDGLIVIPEPDHGLVRRPKYLDAVVLSDALAHLEAVDHGNGLRGILEGDAETSEERETTRRTDQVRALNKAIEAARRRADLATVITSHNDELPVPGKVIEAHGRLRILPATRVAELLVRAEPLLAPSPSTYRGSDEVVGEGSVLTRTQTSTTAPGSPIVAAVETPQGSLYIVLEADALEGQIRDGDTFRLLGIVEKQLQRRDRVQPDDYLPQHLPAGVRGAMRERDLVDVAVALAEATGTRIRRKDLVERGPGAVVTPAALW